MTAYASDGARTCRWRTAPAAPRLGPHEVHVWLIDLDGAADHGPAAGDAAAALSPDEKDRAARFRLEPPRLRFVSGRIAVRGILARYGAAAAPGDLQFTTGPHGRPALAGGRGPHFNFTRSGPLALCAVGTTPLLGVDLELIRPIPEAASITQSHFSAREQELLASLGEAPDSLAFQRAFYAVWTRKEAFIKALGLGLAQPLDSFSVTALPGQRPRLLEVPDGLPAAWTLRAFSPAPGYQAALAVRATGVRLSFWRWTGPTAKLAH